jgi:hypothetical protein
VGGQTVEVFFTGQPADFNEEIPGILIFTNGQTSKSFTLTINNDGVTEGIENALFQIRDPSAGITIGTPDTATLTIVDPGGLPLVSLNAIDNAAIEINAEAGTFRFSRSGATTSTLIIFYTISGTASPSDYNPPLLGSVTIPIGFSFVDVVITPVNDGVTEIDETLILTITANASYILTTPTSGTIVISDQAPLGDTIYLVLEFSIEMEAIVTVANLPPIVFTGIIFTIEGFGNAGAIFLSTDFSVELNSLSSQGVIAISPVFEIEGFGNAGAIFLSTDFSIELDSFSREGAISITPVFEIEGFGNAGAIFLSTDFSIELDSFSSQGVITITPVFEIEGFGNAGAIFLSTDFSIELEADWYAGSTVIPPIGG